MTIKPPHPQYLRIHDALATDLAGGRLLAGERFPTERELAERFGCTRVTLRQALQRLEAEGVIYRGHRRGWFVSPAPIRYDPTRVTGFMEYVSAQGREPRTECLLAERRPAEPWLAARMGLAAGTWVYRLERRRWVDGRPVLLESNVLREDWCPGLLDAPLGSSLTELLRDRYQRVHAHSEITLKPCLLDDAQGDLLQLASGSGGLYLERLCFAESGEAVEFDREYWRPDAVEVTMKVSRA
ncbi:UTRA domain-containing protein [Pseudomonas sp. RIT-PI-S]|uniref:UTRA domain-containing protein n=1 Tax=Pseudomonas sp. RIT-PI-S TaxID=3035295 RepID=UPI0021D9278C|nr:UTRA domain-containing protein [Pseudomonas sp. RIT-PI-S]